MSYWVQNLFEFISVSFSEFRQKPDITPATPRKFLNSDFGVLVVSFAFSSVLEWEGDIDGQ